MKYPLGENEINNIRTKTGKGVNEITVDAVVKGYITSEDIKISKETLQAQSDIARNTGRRQLADNFDRASEMVNIPDNVILDMYNKLRPNRSTKEELLDIIKILENDYKATSCANLVRDALEVYEKRGVLL